MERPNADSINPDTILTLPKLDRYLRGQSPDGRVPHGFGIKQNRRALHAQDERYRLHGARRGNADVVRLRDFYDYYERLTRAPRQVPPPTKREQIDRDVAATIHAQQERKRLRG